MSETTRREYNCICGGIHPVAMECPRHNQPEALVERLIRNISDSDLYALASPHEVHADHRLYRCIFCGCLSGAANVIARAPHHHPHCVYVEAAGLLSRQPLPEPRAETGPGAVHADQNLLAEVIGDDDPRTYDLNEQWQETLAGKGDDDHVEVTVYAGTLRRILDRLRGPSWRGATLPPLAPGAPTREQKLEAMIVRLREAMDLCAVPEEGWPDVECADAYESSKRLVPTPAATLAPGAPGKEK